MMLSLYLFFPFRGNFLYEAPWARLQQLTKSNKEIQGWTDSPLKKLYRGGNMLGNGGTKREAKFARL